MKKLLLGIGLIAIVLGLCCTRPRYNAPLTAIPTVASRDAGNPRTLFFVSLSGGGTRAACMSWEALKWLAAWDYQYDVGNRMYQETTLGNEIDYISGISGGSFAAGAWFLYRDSMSVFDRLFIEEDIERKLLTGLLTSPSAWFSPYYNRIDIAAEYYNDHVFRGAVFGDLPSRPVLWINATHLALGLRFTYSQRYFNYLNSDCSRYWLGYACAASSAFPVLLDPITLKNYSRQVPDSALLKDPKYRMAKLNSGSDIEQYYYCRTREFFNDSQNTWHHMADGGLVDNQGLQVVLDQFATNGVINKQFNARSLKRLIFLNVNAWTLAADNSCKKERPPHVPHVVKYTMTTSMDRLSAVRWSNIQAGAAELWKASQTLGMDMERPYCIEISLRNIKDGDLRRACYAVPTSFSLDSEQLRVLRRAVPELLEQNPEMQRLTSVLRSGGAHVN